MELYDLEHRVSPLFIVKLKEELNRPLKIKNALGSSFTFIYERGTVQLVTDAEQIFDHDYDLWLPLMNSNRIDTICGMHITPRMCSLDNIRTIVIQDISMLDSLSDWMFQDSDSSSQGEKTISYIGKPLDNELFIEGKFHDIIAAVNLPLNQDLRELLVVNPTVRSLGINGDNFNYWNTIPDIEQLVVYVTDGVNTRFAMNYLNQFTGKIVFVRW